MNPIKKSFLTSVVALVLCLTMFLGTTFAWFTDVVTSSGNIIQTGSLKIDLELLDKESGKWNSIKESKSPLFDYNKWEPGYVDVKVLKVENEGTLALKWKAMFVSDEQLSALADVIDVYVLPFGVGDGADAKYPADRNLDGYTKVGTLKDFVNTIESTTYGNLKAGESAYLGIALKMQDEAGNEYQELSLGKFNIQIVATQMANESDSFGNDYDANAEWPKLENGYAASTAIDAGNLMHGALTSELTIGGNNGVGAVLPADVKVAEGATRLELTMKKVDNDGNLNLGEGENATSFDVHIAGIATDNEKSMRVDLGAVLEAGLGETELKLYHIENGTPVQMTRVNTVSDFAIHNQYTYDSATGNVSIYVKSFSVFSAVKTGADDWDGSIDASWYNPNSKSFTLNTAEQFAGFRAIVDGGYYDAQGVWKKTTYQDSFVGKTVTLGKDIDLKEIPFDPIGFGYTYDRESDTAFMGTFDGGNHTVYNLYQNCWELDPDKTNYGTYTYSTAGGGLFASIEGNEENPVVIKNLAISGAEIVFECVDMGIVVGYAQGVCHFENIVVTNSNIANYNRYTGGVVGEVSHGPYGLEYTDENGEDTLFSHTFKNITVDSTVTVSGLWGSFGCGMGGVIGGKWGDATVKMENVVSAPVMDVYNDVVSAYQWYAFRGCGMLIGHTEEPYSDGRTSGNAEASFLTCEDVRVYYGDWVNYNYYEFANQDSDTGKRYPWVRAEAGNYCEAFSNIRYGVPTHTVDGKVITVTAENADTYKTGYAAITFDQLYGADRGMYGTATHDGVTVVKSEYVTKTIYFENSKGWENVKLQYQYGKEGDTWTTVVDGIPLGNPVDSVIRDIYKVAIPSDAYSFTIIGDGESNTTGEILNDDSLAVGELYSIDRNGKVQHCAYNGNYNTVYFYNNKNWSNVWLYYWYVDSDSNNWDTREFPGEKMESSIKDGSHDIYQFVVPAYAKAFIISDGTKTNQTVDIPIDDSAGKIYDVSGDKEYNASGVEVLKVGSSTYKEGYKTLYLKNYYKWDNVQAYYNIGASWVQSSTVKLEGYDGSDEYYSFQIPNFAVKFNFSGQKNEGVDSRDQIPDQKLSDYTTYNMVAPSTGSGSNMKVTKGTYSASVLKSNYQQLYFQPDSAWASDGARFAIYAFKGSSNEWYSLTNKEKYTVNGSTYYKIWISTSYDTVILCRMNPAYSTNSWDANGKDYVWNQSANLKIPTDGKNFFKSNYGWDGVNGTWSKK